jgi:hypothetical protein
MRSYKWTVLGVALAFDLSGHSLRADSPADLIAYYPLDGNGTDASGNGHNGTVVGATPTENRLGQNGKALLFDGTNSFVSVPDAVDLRLAMTDFTISVWLLETQRDPHFADCIISKRGPAGPGLGRPGDGRGWILSLRGTRDPGTTGRVVFQVSGGQDPSALSNGALSLNQWHHLEAVYHRATATVDMYIDGVLDSSENGVPPPNPATVSDMHIGNDSQLAYNNAYVFHGKISDLRIYGHALDQPETTELFSKGFFLDHVEFTGQALTRMYGGLTVGQVVIVESSPDMVHWTPIQTNIVTSTTLSVTNFINPEVSAEFFRVSVQ